MDETDGSGPSGSIQNLFTKSKNVKASFKEVEDICSSNYDSITTMLEPSMLSYLADRASPSVVQIQCTMDEIVENSKSSFCTGFVVYSSESSLIMTSSSFLCIFHTLATMQEINRSMHILVKFFDKDCEEAKVVYLDYSLDIVLLRVQKIVGKPCIKFKNENGVEFELRGIPIYSVSHPQCYRVIQPYMLSVGTMSQRCKPHNDKLDKECDVYMYTMRQMETECAGAPIFNLDGEVIALHSCCFRDFCFGIGLKSIKKALANFLKLSPDYEALSITDVVMLLV